jgi:zinc transport system ATP-binding protein
MQRENTHAAHAKCTHDHVGDAAHGHGQAQAAPAPFANAALLAARGVSFARSGRAILEQIDIDIHPREIVTVIGPNGAGKTSLVRILLGLVAPDRGEVRRKPGVRIGYAPQRFDLAPSIPMTVERFLGAAPRTGAAAIADVLAEVGAARVRDSQLTALSGGEFQRVVLARALLRDPELLVLDEPVRGVDYAGEAELYTLIGRLRDQRGLGVLLVSHDLHVVMAQSDRVICVNRHVCCSGIPEAVARSPEYVRLFGPEAARAFAVYSHSHDHTHDLAGEPCPVAPPVAPSRSTAA